MATIISGIRDTTSPTGQLRPYSVDEAITVIKPNDAPLFVLLNKFKTEEVTDPKHYYYDHEMEPRTDQINCGAGYAAGATALVVDNITYFNEGDVVKIPRTGETILVTDVTVATSTLTVTRSLGAIAAQAIVDNDYLFKIGNANEEGSVTRDIKSIKDVEFYNYTQIFKTAFGNTKTAEASKIKGGKTKERLRREKLLEHRLDQERAFMFGERSITTTGDHPMTTTGGILEFCVDNNKNFGVVPTEDEMDDWMADLFVYGSESKLAIASDAWITYINRWGRNKLQMLPSDKTYGINVTRYTSAHGKLDIVKSRTLTGSVYGKYMVAVDPEFISMVYLTGRKLLHNIDPDTMVDRWTEEYLSETGIKIKNSKAHGVATFGL